MAVPGLASQTRQLNVAANGGTGSPGSGAFLDQAGARATHPGVLWAKVLALEDMAPGQESWERGRELQAELQRADPWPDSAELNAAPSVYQLLARVTAARNRAADRGGVVTSGGLLVSPAPTKTEGDAWREGFVEGLGDGARGLADGAAELVAAPGKALADATGLPPWAVYAAGGVVVLLGVVLVVVVVRG